MRRPASSILRARAARITSAAGRVLLCALFCGAGVAPGLPAQLGERGRERLKVKAHPRPSARRRERPRARVRPAEVSLWVVSNPPGCSVSVDDEVRGETNAAGELELRLAPGTYPVRVSREGYVTTESDVEVSGALTEQEVDFTLPVALRALNVVTDPPGAEVYLDDVYRGATNPAGLLVIERVNPAVPHKLRTAKDGYQQQSAPVTAYGGQISFTLVPDSVKLRVTTEPPETEVYLDGVYKGTSPTDGLLLIEGVNPNQTHTLRAKREGFTQQSATVSHGSAEVNIKLSPDPVVLLVRSLKQNAAQGKLGAAFDDYDRLAATAPDHQELPRLLDNILQSLQARTAATLRRVGPYGLAAEPGEAREMAALYERAVRLKAGDEAVEALAKYWGIKRLMAEAESSASASEREGLQREARATLSEFGERNTRDVNLLLDTGWVWWRLADRAAAEKSFRQVQELKPDWAYAHFALGSLAMSEAEREAGKPAKENKYGQAISSFTRAIELKRDFARAYALRSISYGVIKRYDDAVASGLQAVAVDPQSAYAHFALGFAYFQKGKPSYRNALDEFNQALSPGGNDLDDATKESIRQKLVVIRRVIKK
jgi:tetratricopeptide (TPR) repeat protein